MSFDSHGSPRARRAVGTRAVGTIERTGPAEPLDLLGRVPYGRLATSMRALPFLAVARHIVSDGHILLRMHRGFGHHEACDGSVVAYGADNYNDAASGDAGDLWSVQFTGPAEIVHPCREQEELFGAAPASVNGEPYAPAYLRVDPHFVTEHRLDF
ncbi:pyridoxamine 5'-phosphate oxidase family protein [Streptomyces sp. CAI-121]|uniref:pyridoxamine 5'-phosphate oxidase family protein n=1 Tax=unclassified Streptomyces TaxID=2593676 RepID=UPI0015871E1D|nr:MULTISPECIES: pyridoxamine 5'-phosphate oxidase family protein [unclassified Streptomyces]NUV66865.1 pyridoxamine 5'-phosphate oxidase family protein [Streptomyces sp. CAI-121]NUW12983.1 pyridoxamine 5'-phosphate oxidase family protein [Streptomyces sp. CAI-68]